MKTVNRLLRAAVQLDRSSLQLRRGLRYAVAVGAPLLLGVAANRVIEGVAISTGALLVGLTDSGAPYRQRVPAMLAASLLVAVATLAGELVGAHDALTVLILALASFAAGLCISAGTWTYLVALMGPITFVGAASVPTDGPHALGRAALILAGGLLQVAFVLVAWRVDPLLPERVAVARLYRSVAAWLARGRTVDDRVPVFLAVAHARDVLDHGRRHEDTLSTLTDLGDRIFGQLTLLRDDRVWWDESDFDVRSAPPTSIRVAGARGAVVSALHSVADRVARPGAPGTSILPESTERDPEPTAQRLLGVTADVKRSWVIASRLRDRQGQSPKHGSPAPSGVTPCQTWAAALTATRSSTRRLLHVLSANLTLRSIAFRHALRLAVAVSLASILARALRLPHDYWVPLTVLWLLRPDFGSTFSRGIQRYAGTTAGAVLATLFAAAVHPGPYALSTLATALSVGIFCFMLANYAVTGVCTTGWVIFVSALAGIPEIHAAADRALDTSLGAVLALGAYLLWPTWERGDVGDAIADMIDADRRYAVVVLGSWLESDQADRAAVERCRAAAREIRTNTEATLARSIAEPGRSPASLDSDAADGLLTAMRHFCDGPLSLEKSLDTADAHAITLAGREFVTELDTAMQALTDAARAGRALQSMPAFERLRAAHRIMKLELVADDPLQLQTGVMVAAVDDAVAALSPENRLSIR